jgi:type VI secretion system VasD/TssJ family lipoprotein
MWKNFGGKMKKNILSFFLLLFTFSVYSCAPKPMAPVEWRYEESAIRLHVKADSLSNLYDGRAHALHVCLYQLREPNAFNQLTETPEGISDLLHCRLFDTGVANARILSRYGIQPGQSMQYTLDRAEGAKYLGIVAGYQVLEKERTVRLLNFPVRLEKVKKGVFKKENIQKPGILNLDLYLGPQQIERAIIVEAQKER